MRGLRFAGNLLLGFVTLVLVVDGANALTDGEPGCYGKVGDLIALLAGFWILFAKADRWKTWVAAFFGLPGLFNGLGFLISGHTATYPYTPVPRNEAVMVIIFAILLIAATFPTKRFRKPCGPLCRVFLSAAVVTFFMAVVRGRATNYHWLAVSSGLFVGARLWLVLARDRASKHPTFRYVRSDP